VSLVGVAAILLGHTKTGIWLLVVSIVLRAVVYLVGWWQERSVKVPAVLSGGVVIAWILLAVFVDHLWSVAWATWAIAALGLIWITALITWSARKRRTTRNFVNPPS
jgi:hypothetical protein